MGWREVAARYRVDLILFAGSLAAYALSSDGLLAHQSLAPHFVYQADAFLHGQLSLTVPRPPNLNDWVLKDGRWYVSFPPFPAVLMTPFVAVAGLSFNDVAFTLLFSAANVALLYRLLRRLQPERAEWEHGAFALIYGFGTLAWSCGIRGEVWFTAETIGVTLTLLYLHASLGARHPVLAGLAVACAAITRTPLAFSAVFFVLEALSPDGPLEWRKLRDPGRWRATLPKLVSFAAAIVAVAIPIAWMNYVRFGSFSEFGHSHLYANRVNEQVRRYGLFHYAFLERNLHDAFTRLPEIRFNPLHIGFNGEGMSLFVTTPLLLYLLWPKERPRLHRALWATVALVAIPGFFYQNSGYYQFGFRFSLDYTPYLILLLALGGRPFTRLFWLAAFAGFAVNAWGASVFNRLY
ncbi:MAG TPA: hypothetical protein VEP66_20140 [Myxococcales bacterium]|nr:hypothetical protein [Myxococcales bacterium]